MKTECVQDGRRRHILNTIDDAVEREHIVHVHCCVDQESRSG